jgi:hypothetical protein
VGANIVIGPQILTALRAAKGELCTALRADDVVSIQGVSTVGAEVHTTRGALFVVLIDRLAAIAAERSSLWLFRCLRLAFGFYVLKTLVQFGAAVGTNRGIGRNLLVALGAVEAELSPALGTDGVVRVHLGSALGAGHLFVGLGLLVVKPIFCHRFILASRFSRGWQPGRDLALCLVRLECCKDSSTDGAQDGGQDQPGQTAGTPDQCAEPRPHEHRGIHARLFQLLERFGWHL